VFWQPATAEEGIRELESVAAQGFRLVKLASWCWTLPTPGSDLERNAEAMLDWCDEHGMAFFLLQNIQFGSAGEGGGLDAAVSDPLAARVFLDDWVRVLKGHRCVAGVILGNEVGPTIGSPTETPRWWAGLLDSLRAQYQDLDELNRVWRTDFGSWEALELPTPGEPGRIDIEAYAESVFASFYGALFDGVLRPALGELEHGVKTSGDPILHRQMGSASVIGWDDVLANYPQWRIKALCDVGRALDRPVFNAELHLYHDTYAFRQSESMSRYRYLCSALNGETTTASFAWGQWSQKPETAAIHARTPAILEELDRLQRPLAALAAADPRVHILLTRALCRGADDGDAGQRPRAERLYAEAAAIGAPWRFVLEEDLPSVRSGRLVVPEDPGLSAAAAEAIVALPRGVRVACVRAVPAVDDHGQPLSAGVVEALAARVGVVDALPRLRSPADDPGRAYRQLTETPYLWWQPDRGHFSSPVTYPKLEARRVRWRDRWLVAVINHATDGEPVRAIRPWWPFDTFRELTGDGGEFDRKATLGFPPLSVRLFVTK